MVKHQYRKKNTLSNKKVAAAYKKLLHPIESISETLVFQANFNSLHEIRDDDEVDTKVNTGDDGQLVFIDGGYAVIDGCDYVGIIKSVVRLAIQQTIELSFHLFPDKESTINRTFLVEINNYMRNKDTFANKASRAGLKEDPVALWHFFNEFGVLSHVAKVVTTYVTHAESAE